MDDRKWFLATSLLVIVGLLLGCAPAAAPTATVKPAASLAVTKGPAVETPGSKAAPPTPSPKPATGQPKYGGILTFPQAAEPVSFDLHQETTAPHPLYLTPAYNGLLQYDPLAWPESKVMSDLVSSWEISPDGLEYTFRVKSTVKWHDGKPFTSEDVKVSLERIRKPKEGTRSPRQAIFHASKEVDTVGAEVVKIRLNYPSAALSSILAIEWLAILPAHVIEAKGDMKRDIIGTGPFKFKGYSAGTIYEYVKNNDYFVKGRLDINLPASFEANLRRGAFDSVSHGEAISIDDPDLLFGDIYVSGGGRNYSKYSNPKIDELFEKQSRALDVESRKKLVREMMTILLQDNPDVTNGWGISRIAHSSRLKNYKMASSPYINNRYQEAWLGD